MLSTVKVYEATTPTKYTLANAPESLTATPDERSIDLSWSANGNAAGTVYELYCNTTKADDNTIRIRITASDNVSTTFYYSINEDGYDVLPADGVITCSLASGRNVLVIKVVDEAGNIAQDTITVWGL